MADISPNEPVSSNLHRSHHFKTFNDDFFKQGPSASTPNHDTFTLFSHLPLELRLNIWTLGLRRHRFLRIDVVPDGAESRSNSDDDNVIRGQEYLIFLRNPPRPCVLSRVCHEAAYALREFYRVRLPCYLDKIWGVALLNPEWDILDIHSQPFYDDVVGTQGLIHFLHALKVRDPSDVGALNLSLHVGQAKELARFNLHSLSPGVLDSYRHIIASLHRLFWRTTPQSEGRVMSGFLTHIRTFPWYNISMPLMANTSTVDFVGPDPRLFQADLHQVWVGKDPRAIPGYWNRVEEALGVRAGQNARGRAFQCRILLAFETWIDWIEPDLRHDSYHHPIINRASVNDYLREESNQWDSLHRNEHFGELLERAWYRAQKRYTPDLPPICPSEVVTTRLDRTAVGFWLFEPVAFPDPDHDWFTAANHEGKTVVKLVGKQPELCLFDLGP